ncbi:hypothetical protein M378DRAFT_867065 [Amanita muscaria Koide BX008]|uniref:F-box domain-containing protein n=1 Tax=Amanita muscaria (strain Koide BX008) TaxID=946122 RepID=A0A0C2SDN5_AMAMK|nr:hypothetical protein M378DRAFT_867065 [Amanita muscaria Koide BX008]
MSPRRVSLSEVDRQNIVYSEAEQRLINNTLKTTRASLLRLATLRSNPGPARRRQLKDQIRQCKVALAPYKKIPKEIWLIIFELYCQFGQLSTRVTRRQSPVVITQVCSAWRQIVLSMPKVWSDVHLGDEVNLARMWLERAGNIPRALETSEEPSHYYHRPQTIQNFICSFPFRKLHLSEYDARRIYFTQIPVESLLLLEDLALLKPTTHWAVTPFSPHRFPNLVSLQVDTEMMPDFHVSRPFATWKKLRVLRLECGLAKAKCLEILRDASSLEDCSLRIRSYYHDEDSTIESADVANLKIFRLSFPLTFGLRSFLDRLTFPNLHTLILITPSSVNLQDIPQLLHYLAQRVGSLRSLNIHRLHVNVDVGLVLECLPLLQVLELVCDKITTRTAERIGRGELGGCLRELHDCGFHNLYEFLQACELRRDVTQSQCPNTSGAIASLDKVSVRSFKRVPDCKRRISKLRKDGVEFRVV